MTLAALLRDLQSRPPEKPIEPELKGQRQEQDRKIREEQDLAAGAVLHAVIEQGTGSETPKAGDLVYVQFSVRLDDEDLEAEPLYSTRSAEGGSGQPLAFRLDKGCRAPRGWEVALKGMTRGQRSLVKVKPSYGYQHPDCGMKAPEGVPADKALAFDMQLVRWYPADQVRHFGPDEDMYRRVLEEGSTWECPRPPFEVTFHVSLRSIAYDGIMQSGYQWFTTGNGAQPLTATLGQGRLPQGLEEALSQMCKGERSLSIIPAAAMQTPQPTSTAATASASGPSAAPGAPLVPAPPAGSAQVEAELQLVSMVQLRDMTGTGEVMKKRLKEGTGQFPIDCPLNDTTVRIHYRVRAVRDGVPQPWAYDSRQQQQQEGEAAGTEASPVELDTGCGEAPDGLEMTVKLMIPGEVASVVSAPRYAYSGREDAPPGIDAQGDTVEFEVQLVSFDKEGHWQVMEMEERFNLAERVKTKANELFKAGKFKFARARYDRLIRLLESTRDYENEDQVSRMTGLKLAVLSNLALCGIQLEEYADAVGYCDKALEYDSGSAKVVFRRARALSLKGDYDAAAEEFSRASELDPNIAKDVERELTANKQRAKAAEAKQKATFRNFFDRGPSAK